MGTFRLRHHFLTMKMSFILHSLFLKTGWQRIHWPRGSVGYWLAKKLAVLHFHRVTITAQATSTLQSVCRQATSWSSPTYHYLTSAEYPSLLCISKPPSPTRLYCYVQNGLADSRTVPQLLCSIRDACMTRLSTRSHLLLISNRHVRTKKEEGS